MNEFNALIASNAIQTTNDSQLQVDVWTDANNSAPFFVRTTQIDSKGNLVFSLDQFIPAHTTFPTTKRIRLTAGKLISVSVWGADSLFSQAKFFTRISLLSGSVAAADQLLILTSGYVTNGSTLNFPASIPESSYSGTPQRVAAGIAAPAPGVELQIEINGIYQAKILSAVFSLTTSAAVATRTVTILFEDAAQTFAKAISRTTQVAGTTRQYILWSGPNMPTDAANLIYLPVPDSAIGHEIIIRTETTNIQAGDQYSGVDLGFNAHIRAS